MLSFLELQKLAKRNVPEHPEYSLAVLGDCATQHLCTAIRGYASAEKLQMRVWEADYNLIAANVLDPESELYREPYSFILLYMCSEKLYERFLDVPAAERADFAQRIAREIGSYWTAIRNASNAKILQFNFAELDDRAFGNYGAKHSGAFLFQLRKLNILLSEKAAREGNVFLVDLCALQSTVGRDAFFDEKLYYAAKVTVSLKALPPVAFNVVSLIRAITGKIRKCVVLDLDNTLWGGVIGDDGMENIQIGELGLGHAFSDFQKWLKELKNRGIILAVCSKNNEETARQPFLEHPEMVLRLEDISVFIANWEDKASNILRIREILNIGMDSMVFLDDNPFERNLVRTAIPEITVPELPEDPAEYLRYLKSLDLFETASYSEADKDRTRQYQQEAQRVAAQTSFAKFDDYLRSLEMVAEVHPFDTFHYPRISQLTQRSNQFNLRTVRYSAEDIRMLAEDPSYLTLYFKLRDKFGDHGLISVVVLKKQTDDTLFVDTWLMSCRVLKRGMEEFIVNEMVRTARENGFARIIGEYIPTQKNAMVRDLYANMGFVPVGNNRFETLTEAFEYHTTFIRKDGTQHDA